MNEDFSSIHSSIQISKNELNKVMSNQIDKLNETQQFSLPKKIPSLPIKIVE